MKRLSVGEITAAVSGELACGDQNIAVNGISTDSRTLKRGMAFFPLIGERFDGHEFLDKAIEAGAAVLVCSAIPSVILTRAKNEGVACIKVADTATALQALATYYLTLFQIKKIAVTGSTGKTTTKEMIYQILCERYNTVRNIGNFNNLIGLPLSVFDIDETTEAVVFEMGMDRIGEIRRLVEILKPEVSLITNIGHSHLEHLETRENILSAKLEIASMLKAGNTLIINSDNDLLAKAKINGQFHLMKVGHGEHADLRVQKEEDLAEKGIEFTLMEGETEHGFYLQMPGLHNAMNAAMAVAAGLCVDIDMDTAARGLEKVVSSGKRIHIKDCNGIKIIDDTYNASPDSMYAALNVLASIKEGRKVAILGDMFELGPDEESLHRLVGEYAFNTGIDVVISVGKNARYISKGASGKTTKTIHFNSQDILIEALPELIKMGDIVLVKGSRGMEMEKIVYMLETERE